MNNIPNILELRKKLFLWRLGILNKRKRPNQVSFYNITPKNIPETAIKYNMKQEDLPANKANINISVKVKIIIIFLINFIFLHHLI